MNIELLYRVLKATQHGRVINAPLDAVTLDLMSDKRMSEDDYPRISDFFEDVSSELDLPLNVVGGGFGCTKITITIEAPTKEEASDLLEELFSSEVFANKAMEVGFDSLMRKEPYLHKTFANNRTLGKLYPKGIPIFISYSSEDENYCDQLEKHMSALVRDGLISVWHDRKMIGGEDWRAKIVEELADTKLFLFLVSADFLASDFCMNIELPYALKRQYQGEAHSVPVYIRSCDWEETDLGKLQGFPSNLKPVASWQDKDEAWTDVVKGIRRMIREVRRAKLPNTQARPIDTPDD